MAMKTLCLCLVAISAAILMATNVSAADKKYKLVCYFGSWSAYRPGKGQFFIENIDPRYCTHVIYAFAKLDGNHIVPMDPALDLRDSGGKAAFERLQFNRRLNPTLKVLIAIGGWAEGSTKYSQMAANPSNRAVFVKSVIEFCKKHGFDGLDMDWEYPAHRGGVPEDKENFILLLKELKEAFQPHGYQLSAAVGAVKDIIVSAYDIPGMSRYLDFINVMSYDLYGSYDKVTGHNAALYARDQDSDKTLNVDYAINYFLMRGVPKEKIILGLGLYGRSFTLKDPVNHDIGAPSAGPGKAGEYTNEPGMLGYNEICKNLKNGWKEVFVPLTSAPYAYLDDQWVGYDNKKSIGIKVDYVIDKDLGGAMVWALDLDDFKGRCHGYSYPLLREIAQRLIGNVFIPTERPSTATPFFTTPTQPEKEYQCRDDGYFRDPVDCNKFHMCVKEKDGTMRKHTYYCGIDAGFDEKTRTCTYKHLIPECNQE